MSGFLPSVFINDYFAELGVGELGVSQRIAPITVQDVRSGTFLEYGRDDITNVDTMRAEGEEYNSKDRSTKSERTFKANDYGLTVEIPYSDLDGAAAERRDTLILQAALSSRNALYLTHAKKTKSLVWGADLAGFQGIYGSPQVITPGTKWNTSGGTIENNIATGKNLVYKRSGVRPNVLGITQEVFDAITTNRNSSIYDRVKYTDSRSITLQALASMLELEEVIILNELQNNAKAGVTQDYIELYTGDNAILFRREAGSPTQPVRSLAQTFVWDNPRAAFAAIEQVDNPRKKQLEVTSSGYMDVQLIKAEYGMAFFDVLG